MRRFFLTNIGWKLLSLAIATALWFGVAREPEIATSLNVPIEFKNMPDDLDISSDIPERVRLEIRGPSGRLGRENIGEAAVLLDLATIPGPGERTFTFTDRNVKLPIGVNFYRAVPSQITIRFEHLIYKNVPVRARYSTGPADGYAIVKSSFDPPTVRIVGPESHVQPIEFVSTDPVDLSNVLGESEIRVHLNVGDPQVRLNPVSQVHFKVTLEKRDMN
jgi:YbbR domain-containing protein